MTIDKMKPADERLRRKLDFTVQRSDGKNRTLVITSENLEENAENTH